MVTAPGGTRGIKRGNVQPERSAKGSIPALRQLLLLRHAKSLWDDPKLSDHARPLNARGRASARSMRAAMHELGLSPDLVLVSSARRTLQTLESLLPWDDAPLIEPMDALYLASASAMLDVLHDVAETVRSVLLIGHNPGLHELAMTLVGAQAYAQATGADVEMLARLAEGYPTGALAEFSLTGPWGTLGEGGGRMLRFLAPRDLPDGR
jgi:phosphohistidine phosphatase